MRDFVEESNRIERIFQTTDEEILAHEEFINLNKLSIAGLVEFVNVCQPNAGLRDSHGLDVRVGNYFPPGGGPEVISTLQTLLDNVNESSLSPFEAHVEYEMLHPFTDCNGRSGRVLWLWMMREAPSIGFLHTFYYQTLASKE